MIKLILIFARFFKLQRPLHVQSHTDLNTKLTPLGLGRPRVWQGHRQAQWKNIGVIKKSKATHLPRSLCAPRGLDRIKVCQAVAALGRAVCDRLWDPVHHLLNVVSRCIFDVVLLLVDFEFLFILASAFGLGPLAPCTVDA